MSEKGVKEKEFFEIYPIGYARRAENDIHLDILEPFRPALKQLEHFSHLMVF
jgi:tRNA (Thr-GGU) A37 N-methylase